MKKYLRLLCVRGGISDVFQVYSYGTIVSSFACFARVTPFLFVLLQSYFMNGVYTVCFFKSSSCETFTWRVVLQSYSCGSFLLLVFF